MAVGCRQYWLAGNAFGSSNMTFQQPVSMSTALSSEGGSSCNQLGSEGAAGLGCPMTSGGRHDTARRNIHPPRSYYPGIHPLIKSGNGKVFFNCIVDRSPYLSKDDKLEADVPENDICGRHFLFDKRFEKLQTTSTLIPPLPKGNLHRFSLHKELPLGPAVRPFTLGCYKEYDLNTSPAVLCPTTLALSGRNAIAVDNYKFNRPKVNYRNCNLFTFRENQRRGQSFPDPMIGAPHAFIHRISEISSLEGETVRQEKIKKIRKARKPDS